MLVFTATNGSGTQLLSVTKPSQSIAWFHLPSTINLFIANSGNTQSTPQGYITLSSSKGKLLSRTILNTGSALILPGSTRLLESQLITHHTPLWPGFYHLTLVYGHAGSSSLQTQKSTFLYVGKLTISILVSIVVIVFGWLLRRGRSKRNYRLRT
jgi:hypothetical protein